MIHRIRLACGVIALAACVVAAAAADADKAGTAPAPAGEERLQDWQWYTEIAAPKAGDSPYFDFVVPPAVFDKAEETLADLRIVDAQGHWVPYVLRVRRATQKQAALDAKEFNRATRPDGAAVVSLDLLGEGVRHNEIEIKVNGVNYRRRVHIETSDNAQEWTPLFATDPELLFFQQGTQSVEVRTFKYPESRRRYVRVAVQPDKDIKDDKPVIDLVRVLQGVDVKGEDVTQQAVLEARKPFRVDGSYGSAWMLTLNRNGWKVPCERLNVKIDEEVYDRRYRVEVANTDDEEAYGRLVEPFRVVGGGVWTSSRKRGDTLEANMKETFAPRLRLVVTDSANPPLTVRDVTFSAPARQVIFAKSGDLAFPLKVYFGNHAAREPKYDIAQAVPAEVTPIRLTIDEGAPQPNPTYQAPPVPWTDQHPALVYIVLGFASVVLCVILAMLGKQALARRPSAGQASA